HNLRCTHFRLGGGAATDCAATVIVVIRLTGFAKLALRKRLARNGSSIDETRRRARSALLRTATLRRATALRTTGLTRTIALRRRAHVIATLGAGFGLRHTL